MTGSRRTFTISTPCGIFTSGNPCWAPATIVGIAPTITNTNRKAGVTTMVKCPHCKRDAMSRWRKSSLGPGRVVICQSCGKRISAHWTGVFAAIPAFLGGFALMKSESLPLGLMAVAAGILVMGLIHTFLVPLIRNDA